MKIGWFPGALRAISGWMLTLALVEDLLRAALREDLASGDLTSEAVVAESARGRARAIAKAELVVCGGPVFVRAFQLLDSAAEGRSSLPEGHLAKPGDVLWEVAGNARALLMAERTALNFVQRMSGTATATRRCVDALPDGARTRIADTRKTTPLLRLLERYAVRMGGGFNHRDDLGAAVMIKDNHVALAGGVKPAIRRAREHAPHTAKIEIEVDTLEQLDEALEAGADIVMLDNFDDDATREALRRVRAVPPNRARPLVEASGNITDARIAKLGGMGVDIISVGALTHSARAADISLDMELLPAP